MHRLIIGFVVLLMLLPVAATLLYSLSTHWGATVLPDGLTVQWYPKKRKTYNQIN